MIQEALRVPELHSRITLQATAFAIVHILALFAISRIYLWAISRFRHWRDGLRASSARRRACGVFGGSRSAYSGVSGGVKPRGEGSGTR